MKLLKYLFWNFIYLFKQRPRDLVDYLIKHDRCKNPYKKFKPSIYYDDRLKEWNIWFTDEESYVEKRTMLVEVCIGMKSKSITGISIREEDLNYNVRR